MPIVAIVTSCNPEMDATDGSSLRLIMVVLVVVIVCLTVPVICLVVGVEVPMSRL